MVRIGVVWKGCFFGMGLRRLKRVFWWVSRVGERRRGCECLANVESVYKRDKLLLRSTLTA